MLRRGRSRFTFLVHLCPLTQGVLVKELRLVHPDLSCPVQRPELLPADVTGFRDLVGEGGPEGLPRQRLRQPDGAEDGGTVGELAQVGVQEPDQAHPQARFLICLADGGVLGILALLHAAGGDVPQPGLFHLPRHAEFAHEQDVAAFVEDHHPAGPQGNGQVRLLIVLHQPVTRRMCARWCRPCQAYMAASVSTV